MAFVVTGAVMGAAALWSPRVDSGPAEAVQGTSSVPSTFAESTTMSDESPAPIVTGLAVGQSIPLRVLAVRPNNPSLALLDFRAGTRTVYPPDSHAVPPDAVDGAVMTRNGEIIIWTQGIARLFTDSLDSVDVELEPSARLSIDGFSPALRVAPTPDGQRAWLVQPGIGYGAETQPTLAELIELPTGRHLESLEIDGNALPVGATNTGLVLNTERLFDTGDGWTSEPGSQRVLHLLEDGSVVDIGDGRAIAASPNAIVRLVCPESGTPECGPHSINDLIVDRLDSTSTDVVLPPTRGTWMPVGGPSIPTDALSLQTVSPDGIKLLISHGQTDGAGDVPTESALLLVDLRDGSSRTIAEFDGAPPMATWPTAAWSADGEWIALFFSRDIHLVNANDPENAIMLTDVIPEDHYPLAAG